MAKLNGSADNAGRERFGDATFALFTFLTTSLGFASWYTKTLFGPKHFVAHYEQGIFRYRILGRELVWFTYQHVLDASGAAHLNPGDPGRLFSSFLIVNGIAFVGVVFVLRGLARRLDVGEPRRTFLVWTLGAIVALSGYVVTPYDYLSYALLGGFVLLALSPRRNVRWIACVVGAVGMLNRETMFLGVAVLAAVWSSRPDDHELRNVTIGAAVAMIGTYLWLRLFVSGPGTTVWDSILIGGELRDKRAWIGIGVAALASALWIRVVGLVGIDRSDRRARWIFFALALPYVIVILLTGRWFECRLIVPLIIGDFAVRCASRSDTARVNHPATRGSDAAEPALNVNVSPA